MKKHLLHFIFVIAPLTTHAGGSSSAVASWLAAHRRTTHFPATINPIPGVLIYFGNANEESSWTYDRDEIVAKLDQLRSSMALHEMAYARPVHGSGGHVMQLGEVPEPLSIEGDYLLTDEPGIGLVMATADCLPIVVVDPEHRAVAIAHAGWRGTAARIAEEVIRHMQDEFDTHAEDLRIFFGPSTRCFGELTPQKLERHGLDVDAEATLEDEGEGFLVDLSVYNQRQLEGCGVPTEQIVMTYNACTKCDPLFCSYERDNSHAKRQCTLVALTD